MRGRNRKVLREGDVCVVHLQRKGAFGELVEFEKRSVINPEMALCRDSKRKDGVRRESTTWVYPKHLEIIGNLKDRRRRGKN
jgi:hypothetical protein